MYDFLHPNSEIKSIEIVEIGLIDNNLPEPEQKNIRVIDDIASFLNDFSKIDCFERRTNPSRPREGCALIKITYNNKEYELIDYNGQSVFRDGYYYAYSGWYSFDEDQFSALVSKYS